MLDLTLQRLEYFELFVRFLPRAIALFFRFLANSPFTILSCFFA